MTLTMHGTCRHCGEYLTRRASGRWEAHYSGDTHSGLWCYGRLDGRGQLHVTDEPVPVRGDLGHETDCGTRPHRPQSPARENLA